jgi:tetratricopeptide (TPR) repeat protein
MNCVRGVAAVVLALLLCPGARAGLYYSGEAFAELPSQWRGFLLDQRALRNAAAEPKGAPATPLRAAYLEAAAALEKTAKLKALSADQLADLGALYVRLGQSGKAVELLREAQRTHPDHFAINANLGAAWQTQGDLGQAALALQQAVRLASEKNKPAEQLHLKLVRLRAAQAKDMQGLDDLFGVRYVGESGKYEVGKLADEQRKKMPADAAALLQRLALSLPADGRLLWQLAELANAHGDPKTAAAIMDGCVNEFGMNDADLRQHRQLTRTAADARDSAPQEDPKPTHEGHLGGLKPKSRRPLPTQFSLSDLPPVSKDGVNMLPWPVLAETIMPAGEFKPSFIKYLKELDGKQVAVAGFMQPLGEDNELGSFMLIEYPVGCWYCETPEITGIVAVDLPPGKTTEFRRGLVKVVGTLKLNGNDPESFLYTLTKAKVTEAD